MPASRDSVDQLFALFAASYGKRWLDMWDGMDMDLVASVWMAELDGLKLRHIKFGLQHRPREFPPTAMQFRDLCKQAPDPPMQSLPDNTRKADPARLQAILATIPRGAARDPLACAQKHLERLNAGERLTPTQRDLVRKALPHVFDKEQEK